MEISEVDKQRNAAYNAAVDRLLHDSNGNVSAAMLQSLKTQAAAPVLPTEHQCVVWLETYDGGVT